MESIPLERYAGSRVAFGVYGLPSIARPSRRTAVLLALIGLAAALYVAGLLDLNHAFLGAGVLTTRSKEWRTRRGQITHDMRAITEAAKGPALSPEDEARWSALETEDNDLIKAIEREEKLADTEARNDEPIQPPTKPTPRNADGGDPSGESTSVRASKEYQKAFSRFLRNGDTRGLMAAESRATADGLQADSDIAGGFTYPSVQFVDQLIKFVDDQVFIRQAATVQRVTSADALGVPSLDADPDDGDWTQELTSVQLSNAMTFGKRELRPHELTKGIKVSRKLIARSALPIEDLVRQRLGYKFAITQEKGFLTGTGTNQPLGIFTASSDGIATAQDTQATNTTSFTADDLINTLYSVKAQYQRSGQWLLHRLGVKMARKLKDGEGDYIWQPGLAGGQPDTILSRPFIQSEYVPSTFTTGLYVAAFGDLSFYWIADADDLTVQRLDELYALTNQYGFIARMATDGMPVLSEAFARLKLA